jgi:hypothetical protein
MRILLAIHAILLLLVSTNFTIVTALFGKTSWQWCYFRYSSRNGFGVEFVSDYSPLAIVTYLLAFAVGIAGFSVAFQHGRRVVGLLGAALSLMGLISFAIEGSHWIFDHHRSWLAFSPAIMFVLVAATYIPKRFSGDSKTQPTTASSISKGAVGTDV